jgi:hypothetical protein
MRILLSVASIVGGFLATAILVVIATAIATKVFNTQPKPDGPAIVPLPYLSANLILSLLAAVAGGYVCSRIAPTHPFVHVIVLAGLFEILSLATAVTTGAAPGQPTWYPWVIGLICVSGILIGGSLRTFRRLASMR